MENVSPIAEPVRIPIDIPVRQDLFDHRFGNRPVFPAVEAMEIMAAAVRSVFPDAAVGRMAGIRFDKFLPVATDADSLAVYCALESGDTGGIRAELRSRSRLPSGFFRTMVHASAEFAGDNGAAAAAEAAPPLRAEAGFPVSAERLYRELVPFGPAFRTLTGRIELFRAEARAEALCPRERHAPGRLLGNSFVLDGAFHAACAWGQRYAGIVAFPVGIDRRRVILPTRRGEPYSVRAVPSPTGSGPLAFTVDITDGSGRLREKLQGVRMRDVSGGRWKPPDWILSTDDG